MKTVSACEMGLLHQDADETIVITHQWKQNDDSNGHDRGCFLGTRWTDKHPGRHSHEPVESLTQLRIPGSPQEAAERGGLRLTTGE